MVFKEPRFNEYDVFAPSGAYPDVAREDPIETERFAAVWDACQFLRLIPSEAVPDDLRLYSRIFNNFKNTTSDRQIGDRRGQNFRKGRLIDGPSHDLPSGSSLLQLMPLRFKECLRGFITDRKDFYHQFGVSWERALTNVMYLLRPLGAFKGTAAYGQCLQDFSQKRRKKGRNEVGDFLRGKLRGILVNDSSQVAIAFIRSSVPRGSSWH